MLAILFEVGGRTLAECQHPGIKCQLIMGHLFLIFLPIRPFPFGPPRYIEV